MLQWRQGLIMVLLAAGSLSLLPALSGCKDCQDDGPGVAPVDRSDGQLPLLVARRLAPGAVKLDGQLTDPGWKQTSGTGPFVHPGNGKPQPGSAVAATAGMGWDPQHLLVWFRVADRSPSTPFSASDVDPHIWARASGVELMIQPGDHGDNRSYFEIQVDVAGAVWDTRFDDYNRPITAAPGGGRRYGHQQWKAGLTRGIRVQRGSHYIIELAIPWASLASARASTPPRPGEVWRVNLYTFRDGQRAALAWSPTLGQGNFHKASRFGRVRFAAGASN